MSNNHHSMRSIGRRDFLKQIKKIGFSVCLTPAVIKTLAMCLGDQGEKHAYAATERTISKTATYWERIPGTRDVRCTLCPRMEILKPGQTGFCRVRKNVGGDLVTFGYGQPCILNVDPIGKNPLFHYYPEMIVLSVAHAGCNLRCRYCQNWQYAQESPLRTRNINSFKQAETVSEMKARAISGISFTYTEPACCPEFLSEFAGLCGEYNLKRTLCTAGYINKNPFGKLLKHFEAITITYKGPDETFYNKVTSASLKPVLDAMLLAKSEGKWLEIATLIVPSLNDDKKSLMAMAHWIRKNLGEETPWLIEKFDPQYKLTRLPPTSQTKMEIARQIGLDAGLKFVYLSNLAPHPGNHTYCPSCHHVLIKRMGFKVLENAMNQKNCMYCGTEIPGVWM